MSLTPNPIFSMSAVSRRPVTMMNHHRCQGKTEPKTKPAPTLLWSAAWLSTAAKGTPRVPVETKSSSLLVILHYLLKNNITFMGGIDAGQDAPPHGYLLTSVGEVASG